MSSQQKNLVYALWQEVPKLVYAFWTCKPVVLHIVRKQILWFMFPGIHTSSWDWLLLGINHRGTYTVSDYMTNLTPAYFLVVPLPEVNNVLLNVLRDHSIEINPLEIIL